jgi:hypothetical protein
MKPTNKLRDQKSNLAFYEHFKWTYEKLLEKTVEFQ